MGDFERYWRRPDVRTIFSVLELDIRDAISFYRLIDVDESNELEIEEFVVGCMRLKGKAKAVDMESLMIENKGGMRKTVALAQRTRQHMYVLEERLDRLATSLSEFLQGSPCSVEDL